MTAPLVSVLMAVHNTERYVAQAVESILRQTFTDFELVIIDDGSTDRSGQVLQRAAAQDQRIRLIAQDNQGIAKTRNRLLTLATGEFLAIMDSDDIALPDRLARQVAFLQQHPEVVWVGGAFELIDAAGRSLTRIALPEQDSEIKRLLYEGHTSFLHPASMMRRSAVLAVGGYDQRLLLAEDLDLWLKLSQVGALANLGEVVVRYRIHGQSICDRYQAQPPEAIQEVLDRAWQAGVIGHRQQVTTVCGWRPGPDRASRHRFMLRYGWWAFESSQRWAAADYGVRAIALQPGAIEGWKLLLCALVKPLPAPAADRPLSPDAVEGVMKS